MRKLPRQLNRKHINVAIIVFLITMLVLALFALVFPRTQVPQDNIPTTPEDFVPLDTIPFEDSTQIKYGDVTVKLPAGWTTSALLRSTQGTDYVCGGDNCILGIVGRTEAAGKLQSVVISFLNEVSLPSDNETRIEPVTASLAGVPLELTGLRYRLYNVVPAEGDEVDVVEATEDEVLYEQLFGCNTADVCVYAGILSNDLTLNQQQVSEFRQLIDQLVIN